MRIDKICNLSSAAAPPGPVHGIKSVQKQFTTNYDITPPRPSSKVAVVTPTRNNKLPEQLPCSPFPSSSNTEKPSPPAPSNECSTSTPFPSLKNPQKQSFLRKRRHCQQVLGGNEEEMTLLRKQVATQDAILNQMEEQTKALKDIAESAKLFAKTMSDLFNHLK